MKGRLKCLPFFLCLMLGLMLGIAPVAAFAQDERRVTSPDGHVEFRVFVAPQEENALVRVAYQVLYFQTAVVETSFLAIDVWSQEPMLGEATGLIGSKNEKHEEYNSLTANFMQNGSLGRLLNVEARAYNDGVAIRWSIPNSTPLRELLIAEEAMEFALPMHVDPPAGLPLIAQELGAGWIEITEVPAPYFPVMHLVPFQDNILLTRLAKPKVEHDIAYTGATPLTGPWRVVIVGPTRESLAKSTIVEDLKKN